MIRTLIVDHHPALRAGVKVVLEAERDMVVVGDTGAQEDLLPLLRRTRPGRRAARLPPSEGRRPARMSPRQVSDSRPRGAHLLRVRRRVIARRGARRRRRRPARQELLGARPGPGDPRRPAGGRRLLEPIDPGDVQRAMRLLDRQEAQILEMLLDDVPPARDRRSAEHASRDRRATSQRHPGPPVRRTALARGGHPVRPPGRVATRGAPQMRLARPEACPAQAGACAGPGRRQGGWTAGATARIARDRCGLRHGRDPVRGSDVSRECPRAQALRKWAPTPICTLGMLRDATHRPARAIAWGSRGGEMGLRPYGPRCPHRRVWGAS